jgi:hypothetical protein
MRLIELLIQMPCGIALMGLSSFAQPASPPCERSCLAALADTLVASLVSHSPAAVPLDSAYLATEDGQPAALPMMTLWRTVTGAKNKYYVIDPKSAQVFVIATISEGPNEELLFGRLRAEGGKLSEIELYTDRSRANGGFQFDGNGAANFPPAWTLPLRPGQRASRAELLKAGRSIFDTAIKGPVPSAGCVLMENGKIVGEDPEVLKSISSSKMDIAKLSRNADGTVQIPCGKSPPDRPVDQYARTDLIDEDQGIVVSLAMVNGMVEPYVITNPTDSAFVPNSMLSAYTDMLKKQQHSGAYATPALRPMPASLAVAELYRIYDGKLQGMMMLQNMAPVGATSPWIAPR